MLLLSTPVLVLVRIRLDWGTCKNVCGAVYDIKHDEILIDTQNKWIKNIFKYVSDQQLVPNIQLVGEKVQEHLARGQELYLQHMNSGE
jgi:hypothetical protein